MGEIASLWSYEQLGSQNHDVELLGEKLMCTTFELEKLKAEAFEEMRKNKDYIKQLIHLLRYAIEERDEARNQFQKLLNTAMPISPPPLPLPFQSAKANSSITESNSLSETHNFDAVSSPELSNINFVIQEPNTALLKQSNQPSSCISPELDQAALIVDNLAKGAVLPQKGTFLQTVIQAGPLLQTLLVSGPLPRWRNPPLFQPSHIPPFLTKDLQLHSTPMLSFGTTNANDYTPLAKRQRF